MTCFFKINVINPNRITIPEMQKGVEWWSVSDQMTIVNLSCVAIRHLFSSNSWC